MGENSTPGPWMLQPMANGARVLGGRHLRIVAHIPAQREADARLIAAAPIATRTSMAMPFSACIMIIAPDSEAFCMARRIWPSSL